MAVEDFCGVFAYMETNFPGSQYGQAEFHILCYSLFCYIVKSGLRLCRAPEFAFAFGYRITSTNPRYVIVISH
jgi:hypothetical protein